MNMKQAVRHSQYVATAGGRIALLSGSGQLQPICRLQDVLLLSGHWSKCLLHPGQGRRGVISFWPCFRRDTRARLFWRWAEKAGMWLGEKA